MKELKKLQLSNELFSKDFPVFRLEQHTFLTQKDINRFLKSSFKNSYIQDHSFTSIANFPDIANDNHIISWGRWRSKIFSTYQKAKKNQKRWIFRKIEKALAILTKKIVFQDRRDQNSFFQPSTVHLIQIHRQTQIFTKTKKEYPSVERWFAKSKPPLWRGPAKSSLVHPLPLEQLTWNKSQIREKTFC